MRYCCDYAEIVMKFENEFLYTGEQYSENTGLYYLRARYMDPSTGTFISMDSYGGSISDLVTLRECEPGDIQ